MLGRKKKWKANAAGRPRQCKILAHFRTCSLTTVGDGDQSTYVAVALSFFLQDQFVFVWRWHPSICATSSQLFNH